MKSHKFKIVILILPLLLLSNLISNSFATTARYAYNFDDIDPENTRKINDNTNGDQQDLAISFNMNEGTCIVRGINYMYNDTGPSSHDVQIRFEGDSFWVGFSDIGITHVTTNSWRSYYIGGPTYLLDDDPVVYFIGTDPSDDCIALCVDFPSFGNSYYNNGTGWTQDIYEYIVELIYEWVVNLNLGETKTGNITSNDNVDAYFVSLTAGNNYEFELNRTSGSGDLNMRIVTYQDLTNDNLAQSIGTSYPKYLSFSPSTTATYVLLVEADNPGSDTANYSIHYYIDESPVASFYANNTSVLEGEEILFTFDGDEGNAPATFLWDFGDGNKSSVKDPMHKYNAFGTYNVSLRVNDSDNDSDILTKSEYITVSLKKQYWILPPFVIDDTGGGNFSWSEATFNRWCNGYGTLNNPYIIENVTINGGGVNGVSCIEVRNSDAYFIIKNCTLYNSGRFYYAGILLYNTTNGQLIQNNLLDNLDTGIKLSESSNNNITGNYINNNTDVGIEFKESLNCLINNNTIANNLFGIHGVLNKYSDISFNILNSNDHGIAIAFCIKDIIRYNIVKNCESTAISTQDSYYNQIINNTADGINCGAMIISTSHYNLISKNYLKSTNGYGLSVGNSEYNTISENFLIGKFGCIYEYDSFGNTFENNTCHIIYDNDDPDVPSPEPEGGMFNILGFDIYLVLFSLVIISLVLTKRLLRKKSLNFS